MMKAVRVRPLGMGVLVLSLAAALASCSSSNGGANAGTSDTVHMNLVGPVTSLDPVKGSTFQDYEAAYASYEPMVVFDGSGKLIPGLASHWDVSPSRATFTLKSGVTCSDGTKLTATMAAASLRRFFDPKTAAPWASTVMGGGNTATVAADDAANTVTIKLANPYSGMLPAMTSPFTGIVCPAGLAAVDKLATTTQGTGPFVAKSQVAGSSYTFTRRTGYDWGPKFADQPSGGLPTTLVMDVVSDDSTQANLFETGQLQIAGFTSNEGERFQGKSGISSVVQPQSDTMLIFNESAGHPTADESVRRAISEAIDRKALNQAQGFGKGEILSNLGQPSYQCYDDSLSSVVPKFDAQAARSVLHGIDLRIVGTNILSAGAGNTYVQAALNDAGANAKLNNTNNQNWANTLFSGDNDWDVSILVLGNTASSFFMSGGFFVGAAPPAGANLGSVKSEALASYTQAASVEGDAQCSAFSSMQRELIEGSHVFPLSTAPVETLFQSGVTAVVQKGFVMPGSIRISDN
jgi:peptide/nickel transport system substrate-binding protein